MTVDLLIDLSNVCRDQSLGGNGTALWSRYQSVLAAWRQQVNKDSQVLAVADNSLFRLLSGMRDKAAFVAAQGRGEVTTAPDADPVILDLARTTGAAVLSKDGFVGHRRRHDWIQGDAEHFWSWSAAPGGQVRIARREMRVRTDFTLTRAAEKDERKAKNLLHTDGTPLLSRLWRCGNADCARSGEDPLAVPPLLWHGEVLCPDCRVPVVDVGEREAGRVLKVKVGGDDLLRFAILERTKVTLGRGGDEGAVDLGALHALATKVSRRHLELELRGGQAVAVDLGSSNGTTVERWDPAGRRWGGGVRLHAQRPVTLLPRDRLVLGGAIVVEQSARDYVIAGAAP